MKIKVLGGSGGLARGFNATSFLIDQSLLIDAGSVAGTLSIEEQAKIDNILITHSHLDHIKDLAFICDNCFGLRHAPFAVYTHPTVKKVIKDHLLNNIVWPDFTVLPSKDNPTMDIWGIVPEESFKAGKYNVIPVKVQHPLDAMGYIVSDEHGSVLFSGDTGNTERIWEVARKIKNLRAIFTEVSFPNSMYRIATLSDHHTPDSLKEEIKKMPASIPIILTHLKPNFREEIMGEIAKIRDKRIHVLDHDGESFEF
jgi:ribonuclease BN (tRNA processing enzyme)